MDGTKALARVTVKAVGFQEIAPTRHQAGLDIPQQKCYPCGTMEVQRPRVVVVGSSNTDMVLRAARLPMPGETVLGGAFAMSQGGKGANQAVAAARLGAQVTLVARVGVDVFGASALQAFQMEGIDTEFIFRDADAPSGIALIGVDAATGENTILVAPGANAGLSIEDVQAAGEALRSADAVISQLEIPLDAVEETLSIAARAGVKTILNPAPARTLPVSLLQNVSVLTPNESEAALLAGPGASVSTRWAHALRELGAESVVVTLGSRGALVATEMGDTEIAPFAPSAVVDTTAAGDCFTAALAVALAEGHHLERAARFACAAASLSVERAGAQPSLPTRSDVDQRLTDITDR